MTATPARSFERAARRLVDRADAVCNRLYGSQGNPLYQSGSVVVALYAVLLVTGLWDQAVTWMQVHLVNTSEVTV